MRLQVEQSKLQKSSVGTVVAQSANAVGPVLYLEVQIEGCPVTAVVDTGAQSTILSRETLHRVVKCMREAGRVALAWYNRVPNSTDGVEQTAVN